MDLNSLMQTLGICVVVSPTLLLAVLGLPSLFGRPLSEQAVIRCIYTVMVVGLALRDGHAGADAGDRSHAGRDPDRRLGRY